jgi:cyclopropane-fatty-acyl-phospholipid synthase
VPKENYISPIQEKQSFISRLSWMNGTFRRLLLDKLSLFDEGEIVIVDCNERLSFGKQGCDIPSATVTVKDRRFYRAVGLRGHTGAAESYMLGYWECDNLVNLTRLLLRNQHVLETIDSGLALLTQSLQRLGSIFWRNTLRRSRRNIAMHYDLSNDFYASFLDKTMAYSCGIFSSENSSLEQASLEKFDRICRKLALKPGDRVLEIGTGWGGFAIYAAKKYGCQVTTTTISERQYDYTFEAIRKAGLTDKITLLKKDYRELEGKFDKLASIEMIEAVGYELIPGFLAACDRLLEKDGLIAIQAITLSERYFESYRRGVDFIQQYIFPGACLISLGHVFSSLKKHTDLRLVNFEDITGHYVRTLKLWHEKFCSNRAKIRRLGFSESFIRMWEFYLSYCEGGFRERYIGDVQFLLAKPLFLEEPYLPQGAKGRGR